MAFDPVRDAILNSPERLTYDDPFDEQDDGQVGVGGSGGEGKNGKLQNGQVDDGGFKAPASATVRPGSTSLRANDSPERPPLSTSNAANLVKTPGEYSFPPTPGGSYGSASYGQSVLTPGTAHAAHRQSSIFSLLSPEPPLDPEPTSQQGYFDQLRESSVHAVNGSGGDSVEPFTRFDASTSAAVAQSSKLKPSLAVETSARLKITPEPTKRGRPYAPVRRINGPAPQSLYVPITAEQRAFYLNPANCKNPLRIGVSVATRSAAVDGYNRKGKGKASDEPELPEEIDIAPRYREASPLPAALELGFIQRPSSERPPLVRNGSSGSLSKKRKRNSISDSKASTEYTAVAAHCTHRKMLVDSC